ncbi:MAG TPA: hypothetical protein PKY82_13180 [Pyrinomonadaceae bacterium]|nr:hypothetical protein [Pyrinomonadaceae bacterium]
MRLLFKLWLICAIQIVGLAQVPNPTPPRPITRTDSQQQRQINNEQRKQQRDTPLEDIRKVTDIPLPQTVVPMSSIVKSNRSAEQFQRLLPDAQDLEKYNNLLRSKKSGIFKLFPDFNCDSKNIVNVGEDCENSIPFSWSYSFLRKDYGDGDFFDLRFKSERIVVDGFLTQNIAVAIGDIPIESVTLETSGMKFLLEFQPKVQEKEQQEQFWQIAKKITADSFSYTKVIAPQENMTYLLRIVAYRISYGNTLDIERDGPKSAQENRLLFISYDKTRRDKIIAFRIIRKNPDGSLTIVWNELADKKSPTLKFGKPEKLNGVANSKKP